MHEHEKKEKQGQTEEDDEVICSNQLLAAIRERMAMTRKLPKEKQPKELKIEEAD